MKDYLIIIESGKNNYSAYAPDLPGCVATGKTLEEVKKHMQEAVEFHIHGLLEDRELVPEPTSIAEHIQVELSV